MNSWLRKNLFNTWYNTLLTLVCLLGIYQIVTGVGNWLLTQARWDVVATNLNLLLVGRYPASQIWRLWLVGAIGVLLVGVSLVRPRLQPALKARLTPLLLGLWPLSLVLCFWLIAGGAGLLPVGTNLWGGLLLTLLVAFVSTVLAFPLSVVLAVGRQSTLPLVRWFCTGYIELIRGLPLIGILFMAQVMLPLVLPAEWRLDRLLRAIAGLVLFNAAYLAENVRGGLQAVPRGQTEAAKALGLNTPLILVLIVLPQAIRTVIPAIVGQFISLFKDTSLLSLFALLELTGIARSVLAQPQFLGRYAEVYLFVGLLYWIFCYTLARVSQRWEKPVASRL